MTRIQVCLTCSIHPVHCRAVLTYWLFTLSLDKNAHRDPEGPESQHASFPPIPSKTSFCQVVLWTECVLFKFMCCFLNRQGTVFWKGFWLFGMPRSIVHQNPLSMGFLRQEQEWLPFPSPGNLPDPGIEPRSLPLGTDSLQTESPAKSIKVKWALRMEHSSNKFIVSMKQNTRQFSLLSLCLCVLSSVSFPEPPTLCQDARQSHPGKKEFSPQPHLTGALI